MVMNFQVDTNFQQVEPNKFLTTIANAESLNHVVVFLTGSTPLQMGTACCLFFSMPNPDASPEWNYLGYLSNEKPSAIFKLSNLTKSNLLLENENIMGLLDSQVPVFNYAQDPIARVAQIGISIEPIDTVLQMVPATDTSASNITSLIAFMNKTVESLFNYCSSYARPISQYCSAMDLTPETQLVPLQSVQSWYESYIKRLQMDQNFWKKLN